ncbi:unnamed protein product [Macrosiphum euphorbiae]|uniref:RNA-directed DNA polymerase from mobile element jockey n=1 Tax=Macrosiphum euphorbiae TaxID=13131 RepID=A0AAV0WCP7_9HEMI|nr:unnamed protein product [Macrosiphum euphorbiae]
MFMSTSIGMQHAVDKLQTQINATLPWLKNWRLTLSPEKSIAIKLGRRELQNTSLLRINNTAIQWRTTVKYLGVHLDNRLTFRRHAIETAIKAKRTRAALYPIISHHSPIPLRARLNIFQMYVRTTLTYAGPAWGAQLSLNSSKKLEAVQNVALRTITGSPWYVRNTTIQASTHKISVQQSVTKDAENMYARLATSNHHHLRNICQTIGPEETARKRPKALTI